MEMLSIGRNKAYELLRNGEVKSMKLGKAYRIPKDCIRDYVLDQVSIKIEEYKLQHRQDSN
ncbi:Helix-turn-helix domain protein [compost metagenome]